MCQDHTSTGIIHQWVAFQFKVISANLLCVLLKSCAIANKRLRALSFGVSLQIIAVKNISIPNY